MVSLRVAQGFEEMLIGKHCSFPHVNRGALTNTLRIAWIGGDEELCKSFMHYLVNKTSFFRLKRLNCRQFVKFS